MLTSAGLVALYDIRPGNGAGPFLQPRSPHGARKDGQGSAQDWKAYCLQLKEQQQGISERQTREKANRRYQCIYTLNIGD